VRKREGKVRESKSGGEGRSDCMVDQNVKEGLWLGKKKNFRMDGRVAVEVMV
jgi:hypothetical protein